MYIMIITMHNIPRRYDQETGLEVRVGETKAVWFFFYFADYLHWEVKHVVILVSNWNALGEANIACRNYYQDVSSRLCEPGTINMSPAC